MQKGGGLEEGKRAGAKRRKRRGGTLIGWKQGYTKGVIGPIFFFIFIFWAKVGGDGKKDRRKRVA